MHKCIKIKLICFAGRIFIYKMKRNITIVADSGSTKTDWLFLYEDGNNLSFTTSGLNPYFTDNDKIKSIIFDEVFSKTETLNAQRIEFYGAGCASDANKIKIKSIINSVFPDSKVKVNTDILGAAKSLFGDESGIACILGTGANTCFYNGDQITNNIQSLGFILGDEGSGAYLGKMILKAFLTDALPFELKLSFIKKYNLTRDFIIDNVYNKPNPNAYLAQYCEFLFEFISNEYIIELIKRSFRKFIEYNILKYENHDSSRIGFVGSVGYYFGEQLEQVLSEYNLQVYKNIKSPIEGLKEYYIKNSDR